MLFMSKRMRYQKLDYVLRHTMILQNQQNHKSFINIKVYYMFERCKKLKQEIQQDYKNIIKLEQGGFGQVFLGQRKSNSKCYALKFIKFDKQKERIYARQEANILKTIKQDSGITNIVEFIEERCFQDEKIQLIVLEYCQKGNLENYLSKFKDYQQINKELCRVIRTLFNTLHKLHQKNIIHRDIKQGNVLIASDGSIKLTDFGVSTTKIDPTTITGTRPYMAPQIKLAYSHEVDFFAMGVMIYRLIFKKYPYGYLDIDRDPWSVYKKIQNQIVKFSTLSTKFDPTLLNFMVRCLHPGKQQRTYNILSLHPFINCFVKESAPSLPTTEQQNQFQLFKETYNAIVKPYFIISLKRNQSYVVSFYVSQNVLVQLHSLYIRNRHLFKHNQKCAAHLICTMEKVETSLFQYSFEAGVSYLPQDKSQIRYLEKITTPNIPQIQKLLKEDKAFQSRLNELGIKLQKLVTSFS